MRFHCCQSITGPLRNWKAKDWKSAAKHMTKPDGTKFTPEGLKDAFFEELAKGHEVIPLGDCDNFDYKKGCQGHPEPDEAATGGEVKGE